jgi:hypothetical protein
MSQLSCLS